MIGNHRFFNDQAGIPTMPESLKYLSVWGFRKKAVNKSPYSLFSPYFGVGC